MLRANGHDIPPSEEGWASGPREAAADRSALARPASGACRLLADGVDIRTIQLMLGHADIKQTQRYLNITDEALRKAMTGVWERRRQLKAVSQ